MFNAENPSTHEIQQKKNVFTVPPRTTTNAAAPTITTFTATAFNATELLTTTLGVTTASTAITISAQSQLGFQPSTFHFGNMEKFL